MVLEVTLEEFMTVTSVVLLEKNIVILTMLCLLLVMVQRMELITGW